jgi:hypothetical protein
MTPNPKHTNYDPQGIGENGQKRIPRQGVVQQLEDIKSQDADEYDENPPEDFLSHIYSRRKTEQRRN